MLVYVCHICHFQLTVYGLLVDNKFILLHLCCKKLYVTQISVFHLYHAGYFVSRKPLFHGDCFQ